MSQETKNYQYERNDFNTYGVRGSASGGGTEVIANPEGTATEDLEKLQVGETIYGVESGISQTDADARYLRLAGGTMTGNIIMGSGADITTNKIRDTSSNPIIEYYGNNTCVGNGDYVSDTGVKLVVANNASAKAVVKKGSNEYEILTTNNGLQLSGGTMTGGLKIGNNANSKIISDGSPNGDILSCNSAGNNIYLGNENATILQIKSDSSTDIVHRKGYNNFKMYDETNGVGYTTTAPTADNTKGGLVMVVLSVEPATYYNGYYYIIAPST